MTDSKNSINFSDMFNHVSPFGEDSIFHPSWDETQKERRNVAYDGVKIDDLKVAIWQVSSSLLSLKEDKSSKYATIPLIVTIEVSGLADVVEITSSDGQKKRATKKSLTNLYEAIFNVSVGRSFARIDMYNAKDFIFTATVTDVYQHEIRDRRSIRFSVGTDRTLNSLEYIEPLTTAEFHVYSNGKMEEWIPKHYSGNDGKVMRYVYHEINSKEHEIGFFNVNTIMNVYGRLYGGETVDLIDIRELKNYLSETVYFRISINTNRFFMNKRTFGSLIGAMLECSYNDFVFNGFSNEKGESIGRSKSHKNGQNGDFRYLRLDQSGKRMNLKSADETGDPCGWKGLDEERQNAFNEALYKFGWKSMLSYKYDNDTKLLNRCTKDSELRHHDHLHVQGYKPQFKTIVKTFKAVKP